MPYRLAIFDFDGTLADSLPWFTGVFNDVAARFNFRTVSADEMQMLRGRDNREIVRYLGVPAWKLPLIAAHMRRRIRSVAGDLRLFNGAEDLLLELGERGVKLAVVSSNDAAAMRQVLGERAWSQLDHVEAGAGLFGKAPRLIRAARRLGVKPAEVLTVGDEVRDVEAARRAGMAVAAVTWGYATRAALGTADADHIVDSYDELRALLQP